MTGIGSYAYLNARLRAKLGKLLVAEQYERLMGAGDLQGAYEMLRNTDYAEIFKEVSISPGIRQVESALVDRLIACHREVAAHSEGSARELIRELMRKYEVENLKVILRVWNSNEEREFIYREPICHEIPVNSILDAGTIEEIIVLLDETPYRRPLVQNREEYKKTGSLFYLEVALDRELYEATWHAIGKLSLQDRRVASKLIGTEIDILNINWILRFKRYYSLGLAEITRLMIPNGLRVRQQLVRDVYPAGDQRSLMSGLLSGVVREVPQLLRTEEETQALHLLEGLLREMFLEQVKNALGGFPFTIGLAIAYLRLKKMEVSNIITILNAKALHLPPEAIEKTVLNVRGAGLRSISREGPAKMEQG